MSAKIFIVMNLTASLVAFSAAQTAELPTRKAAPAQQVKICDSLGEGYIYVPGSQTCMRISGYVEVDTRGQAHHAKTTIWPELPHHHSEHE